MDDHWALRGLIKPGVRPHLSFSMNERFRIIASVVLVVIGVVLGVAAGILAYSADTIQAKGAVIDFDEYDTVWTDADIAQYNSTSDLLGYLCEQNGYELVMGSDGKIVSINGVGDGGSWNLWVTYSGSTDWVKIDAPYDQDPNEFSSISWTFSTEDRKPTVAVDYSGNSFYGYSQKYRVVSLSPSVTEILCSVKASNIIVGVDSYSNYPDSVTKGKEDGSITVVGTYTSPSFELITGTNPDMVICDGSQTSHIQIADRLRAVGIDAVVTYPGEDVDQVMDNIFMIGSSIQYGLAGLEVIEETQYVLDTLGSMVAPPQGGEPIDVMISLEPDISPWVSGSGTYMDSIATIMNSSNVFSDWYGWVHLTSDRIPYANPQTIIIITTEYKATQEEYDYLYSHLSPQWKQTDAWKNGNIYVICESAAEMAQRCGPRLAQAAELVAMMLHPDCFDTDVPKIVGDNYVDYLNYSKDMSLNDRG